MRRRFMQSTILAVLLAVLMLGLPLMIVWANYAHENDMRTLDSRVLSLRANVADRLSNNQDIPAYVLDGAAARGSRLPSYVTVTLADGTVLHAGDPIEGRTNTRTERIQSEGATVHIESSYWTTWRASAQFVVLVGIAAAASVAVGLFVAARESDRLTRPLVLLAASAEQLGSGQVKPPTEHSGVEEIDLVAQELSLSADRLAERLASERRFAMDVTHQLRTPLTALSLRLEEIQLISDDAEVAEEVRQGLDQIDRLVETIDDLRERTRRADASTTRPVDVRQIAVQQVEEWSPQFDAAGRRLALEIPGGTTVLASPGPLAQILATLIENSLKHGGGMTTMRLGHTEAEDGTVDEQVPSAAPPDGVAQSGGLDASGPLTVVEVADEGPGISDDLAPRIFERNVTSGKGTGLGLALARNLAASDGGRLELAQRRPPIFALFLASAPATIRAHEVLPPGATVSTAAPRQRRERPRTNP